MKSPTGWMVQLKRVLAFVLYNRLMQLILLPSLLIIILAATALAEQSVQNFTFSSFGEGFYGAGESEVTQDYKLFDVT